MKSKRLLSERSCMSWTIELKPSAVKSYGKLGKVEKRRVRERLMQLEQSDDPLHHTDVKALVGPLKGDYRLRIGGWRILFTPNLTQKMIHVYAIIPRGDAYK